MRAGTEVQPATAGTVGAAVVDLVSAETASDERRRRRDLVLHDLETARAARRRRYRRTTRSTR